MKTRQGYNYYMEDGKYTIDSYDFFDSLEELEADLDWQRLWIDGKAYKDLDGNWRYTPEVGKAKLLNLLNELFGKPLTEEEFSFRQQVLGEQECWLIADRFLTQEEILAIEESWAAPVAA